MSNMLEKRKLDWVGDKRYNLLSKDEIKKLLSYRTTYTLCKKRINKIDRAQRQLDIDKEGLIELKKDLTARSSFIDYLRDKLEFSCYVVRRSTKLMGWVAQCRLEALASARILMYE